MGRFLSSLIAALVLAALAPGPASASSKQFTIFDAPRELHSSNPSVRSRTFDEIQSFGVHWIRLILYWHDVAPQPGHREPPRFDQSDPDAYPAWRWAPYDRIVSEAERRGIRVLLTVSGPIPRWASLTGSTVKFPSSSMFGRFVQAVGRRYGDVIDYWSVWNEPNHPQFLGPQWVRHKPYAPRIYRRLFRAARKGLRRSGNRRDRVLMGETAPNGSGRIILPLRFLRGALCLNGHYRKRNKHCSRLDVDGWAHHPYTTRRGPFYIPRARDAVMIGSLSRLRRALDRAWRAHAMRKRVGIYLTEFGIQSKPDPIYGVGETRQAEYRAIAEQIAYRNARVRAFSQYLMRDDAKQGRRYGGFESGLRYHGGRRKLAYRAFRLPMTATRISRHRTRLWGLVRPARGHERVTIYYRNRHGHRWRRLKSDRTDRRGYWRTRTRYRSGRSYLVRWRDRHGHRHAGSRTRVLRLRRH